MKKVILCLLVLSPVFVFAQQLTYVSTLLGSAEGIVTKLIPFMLALALLFFFWGLLTTIFAKGDEDAIKDGRWRMIWGIIAFAVMVSVWGLVQILRDTFNVTATTVPAVVIPR